MYHLFSFTVFLALFALGTHVHGQAHYISICLQGDGEVQGIDSLVTIDSKYHVPNKEGCIENYEVKSDTLHVYIDAPGYQRVDSVIYIDSQTELVMINIQSRVYHLSQIDVLGKPVPKTGIAHEGKQIEVTTSFLESQRDLSLMQTLSRLPGVQRSNVSSGLSQPMIRGMGFYRVVVAENDLKYEGQQWSSHHGLSIDQYDVDRVEIIKGAASLKYGTDAIGGVINIKHSHIPERDTIFGHNTLFLRSNTGWLGTTNRLSFRKGRFFLTGTVSYSNFGDFRVPDTDEFLYPAPASFSPISTHAYPLGETISNTAGREGAFSVLTGMVFSSVETSLSVKYHQIRNGFFDWQGMQNASIREGHFQSTRDINFPFQFIRNLSVQSHTKVEVGSNDVFVLSFGYQRNNTSEHDRLLDRTGNRSSDLMRFTARDHLDLSLLIDNFTSLISYDKNISYRERLSVGISGQSIFHNTDGFSHILPEYRRHSIGAFFIHQYDLNDVWSVSSGLRLDANQLRIDPTLSFEPSEPESFYNQAIHQDIWAPAISLGFSYTPSPDQRYSIDLSRSYRVPSVYELSAFGLHRHEGRFEQGNADNEQEISYQIDLSADIKLKRFKVLVQPFINYFTNYLYLQPTPYLSQFGQVFEYNQSAALFTGSEVAVEYSGRQFQSSLGFEYVYAVNTDVLSYIPFTPPGRFIHQMAYQPGFIRFLNSPNITLVNHFILSQSAVVVNELVTPGGFFTEFRFSAGMKAFGRAFEIGLSIINLFNHRYFDHVSFYRRVRIPEPGRDVQLTVKHIF